MKVARLVFIRTGQYNDAVIRPYMAYATPDITAQLIEQTQGGKRIEMANMSGLAGQIIRPSTEHSGVVDIVGGWNHTRMRFMAEIHHASMSNEITVQYLTGYTDYEGVNADGTLVDPKLRMFVNNSIMTRRLRTMGGYGMVDQLAVQDASQLLVGQPTTDYRAINTSMHTMRPEDVFGTIGTMHDQHSRENQFYDMRSPFTGSPFKKSQRSNGSPTSYLSKVLKTYRQTMAAADVAADFSDLANSMAGAVAGPTASADPFIGNMMRMGTSLTEGSSFTYGELCGLCRETEHNTEVVVPTAARRAQFHTPGQSETWTGKTHEAMIATMISHAVPAIMCDLMLTRAAFSLTNRTINGQPLLVPGNYQSFAQMDLSRFIEGFEQRMVAEVFRDITRNFQIDIELWCDIDLLGESVITISYMGNPGVRFVAPSFADALSAPVVAYDLQNVHSLATDIDTIANSLSVDYSPPDTGYAPAIYTPTGSGPII